MFCHHRDEAEVYGTEPVPCPLCGMGGDEPTAEARNEPDEDANDALRHALFDDPASSGSELTVVW
jgi:hypothetical protein